MAFVVQMLQQSCHWPANQGVWAFGRRDAFSASLDAGGAGQVPDGLVLPAMPSPRSAVAAVPASHIDPVLAWNTMS